jgi:hypothetical protein
MVHEPTLSRPVRWPRSAALQPYDCGELKAHPGRKKWVYDREVDGGGTQCPISIVHSVAPASTSASAAASWLLTRAAASGERPLKNRFSAAPACTNTWRSRRGTWLTQQSLNDDGGHSPLPLAKTWLCEQLGQELRPLP